MADLTAEQALKAHKDQKKVRVELNERRKKDNEMVTSYAYVMKGTGTNAQVITNVINVTMNRLKVFKAYVLASLNKADEKSVVESDSKQVKTSVIKDYIDAAFDSANYKLNTRGQVSLEPYLDDQACMMGELAARVVFEMMPAEEGRDAYLNTDITYWDTRFITYERNIGEGFAYTGYETLMSKGMIESEPWFEKSKKGASGKEAEVIELWTPEDNIIYIAGSEVFKQPNPFGYTPVVVQKVPIGSMVSGQDNLKYQMESIFFLVRDLIEEYYRCVSVLQTLNFLAIKAATQQFTPPGESDASYSPDDLSPGANLAVDSRDAITLIPYGKAERAMLLALQEINKAINDGTLARITLGDLPGELSAIALIQIEQGQGQVYMPRLGARGGLKAQVAMMIIKQSLSLAEASVEMGTPGHRRSWKLSDLEGEYSIDYRYSNRTPETDFARVSMARSYVNVIDELSILTDVLKRDDPEGDLRRLNRQRAMATSPILQKYTYLRSITELADEGDEAAENESKLLELEFNVTLDQLESGQLPETQTPAQPETPLLPAERSSSQKAADIMRSPIEEVEEE